MAINGQSFRSPWDENMTFPIFLTFPIPMSKVISGFIIVRRLGNPHLYKNTLYLIR